MFLIFLSIGIYCVVLGVTFFSFSPKQKRDFTSKLTVQKEGNKNMLISGFQYCRVVRYVIEFESEFN